MASFGIGVPSAARAGNDDGMLIGGEAALTAGAVTATVSDGSAAWYNPAGLARVERQTLDIQGSAYGISLASAADLFTLPDGSTSDARVIDWQLVPTALSYARRLGARLVGALSVMIPTTTDSDLRTAVNQADGTQWTLGIDQVRNEYDYIASLGVPLGPHWRLGLSLHGIYISDELLVQVAVGKPGSTTSPFQSTSLHETTGDYGARLGLGVQGAITPRLELGISLQTPALTAFRLTRRTEANGSFAADASSSFRSSHQDGLRGAWDVSTPLSARAGLAYTLGRAQIRIDGSLVLPLDRPGEEDDRKLAGNLRLAAVAPFGDTLLVGLGAFTDLNGRTEPGANYFGLTGGMRIASHHTLAEEGRPLTFATTLAGRYAYGFGHTRGLRLGDGEDRDAFTRAELRVHEFALNLGSTVSF